MRKVLVGIAASLTLIASAAPAANATTKQQRQINSLVKSVKSLTKANTTLTVRVARDETRIKNEEARSVAQGPLNTLLVNSSLLLLGLSNCETNFSQSDFTFADGVHTEQWFTGDAFGPNPVQGFLPCVNQAVAAVSQAPTTARLVPRSASGLAPLIQTAVRVKTTAAGGK